MHVTTLLPLTQMIFISSPSCSDRLHAMLSNYTLSSFSSLNYPSNINGDYGLKEKKIIYTKKKGAIISLHAPVHQLYNSLNRCNARQHLRCQSQRFLALANCPGNNANSTSNQSLTKKYCSPATLEHVQPEADHSNNFHFLAGISKRLSAFYRFSRPHTVIGTVLGIISISLLPVQGIADLSPKFVIGLLKALVPSILMNIYIVGLNQLFDIEIDKVNKPDLPLASGEFSMGTGVALVAASAFMSFALGWIFQSPPLFLALLSGFLFGSAYSINLPFLRWKRYAVLAAMSILSVRAVVIQFAFFLHMQKYVLGKPTVFTRSLTFATAFMCFFSAVIALFKDIPDVDGDKTFGIQSFSVSLGQERVFWLCISLLLMAYVIAMVVGALSTSLFSKFVTVFGHGALAYLIWHRAQSLDLKQKASIVSFYMFIWKLFYAEYLLIPFVR